MGNLKEYWLYMVLCADDTLYTGIAMDVQARVAAHNRGAGARYTRARLPVRLMWCEPVGDQGTALRAEHALKRTAAHVKRVVAFGVAGEVRS